MSSPEVKLNIRQIQKIEDALCAMAAAGRTLFDIDAMKQELISAMSELNALREEPVTSATGELLTAKLFSHESINLIIQESIKKSLAPGGDLWKLKNRSKSICATEKTHGEILKTTKKYAEELESAISMALPEPSPEKLIAAVSGPLSG